jgi:hypothetical protein
MAMYIGWSPEAAQRILKIYDLLAQIMTDPKPSSSEPRARRLACSRCGAEFGCDLSGTCWCAEETTRLPMPTAGEDCLCRDCLRKAADAATSQRSA